MPVQGYSKRLNQAAWIDFKKAWSGPVVIRTICGLAVPAIPWAMRRFQPMPSLRELLGGSITGVLCSIGLTYLRSRRKGAEDLDSSLHLEIGKQDTTIVFNCLLEGLGFVGAFHTSIVPQIAWLLK